MSRSRFLAKAAEELVRKLENRRLLAQINEAYADGPDPGGVALVGVDVHLEAVAAFDPDQHVAEGQVTGAPSMRISTSSPSVTP